MSRRKFSRRFILIYRLILAAIAGSLGWFWFSHKDYVASIIITISMAICFALTFIWKRK